MLRVAGSEGGVTGLDPGEEGRSLSFYAVGAATCCQTSGRLLSAHLQEHDPVRLQAAGCPDGKLRQLRRVETPPVPLVGKR